MEAAIIFEPHIPYALQRALDFAGEDGFVASMPQLFNARTHAPYDSIIWNTWFTPNTEESVVTTPAGNHVVVTVHGGGILTPERLDRSYRASANRSGEIGLTGEYASKITQTEASDILNGKLADGTEIPIYQFEDFKRGIANLPMRYGIVTDLALLAQSTRGYDPFDVLHEDANMIVRLGGMEPLAAYLEKAQARHNTKVMGHWHPYQRIDINQPQTKIPFLAGNQGGMCTEDDDDDMNGYDAEYGLGGDACTHNMARFIAVTPDQTSTVRDLNFGL